MDAKTFINRKHEAAIEELRAIEAEYVPRRDAANAMIAMTKEWLEELEADTSDPEPEVSIAELTMNSTNNWVSARDLNPQARLNAD